MKRISALILAGGLLAGDAAANTEIGRLTLRVRSEPNGYGVRDVYQFLRDPAYLGSVDPLAIPTEGLDVEETPAGLCSVEVQVAGGEMLTIQARAEEQAVVRGVLERLVANLQAIEPTSRTMAREGLAAAAEQLERATTRFATSQTELRAFIQKNGAVDPGVWLQSLQTSLLEKTNQLEHAELELAGEQALRDYLAEAIARQPGHFEEPVPGLEQELMNYRSQLRSLEEELANQSERSTGEQPTLKVLQSKIQDLATLIEQRKDAKVMRQNPVRVDLERDLFQLERELALDVNRQRVLSQSVERLRDEARKYALLHSDWRELSRDNELAEQTLRQARAEHEAAQHVAAQRLVGEWIQVVAGPQFTTR